MSHEHNIPAHMIDPLTGLIRPVARQDLPRQQSADMTTARPQWFAGDRLKTTAEIRNDEAQAKFAADRVAAELRARTAKVLSEDERLIQNLSMLIDQRTQAAKYMNSHERVSEAQYVDTLKAKRTEVENKIAEEQRIQRFERSDEYKRVREHSQAFARTPPPAADPQAVALAIAIAGSTEFQDPAEYSRQYFTAVAGVEEAAYAAAINAREQKRQEVSRLEYEAATADVTVAEAALRVAQATGLANE
ncbi:hypothetical protein NA78x_000352 [Anatilimnocola sp. NA78]|uniref:hypothetical protein n=1 Tax=Anatilimnocola sp. NA78 TaxID=3415683 RepID=UPI003CE59A21